MKTMTYLSVSFILLLISLITSLPTRAQDRPLRAPANERGFMVSGGTPQMLSGAF